LLKLRFGEQALQVCDVMLKDMADSKRIDDRIQGDIKVSVRMTWLMADFRSSPHHLQPVLAGDPYIIAASAAQTTKVSRAIIKLT